jgi:hypothetical protein
MTLHICADQMKRLGDAMHDRFVLDAVARLRRRFPETTARHGDDTMRLFVRHGIERARQHRLQAVTDVQRWLDLMMHLGPYFDTAGQPEFAAVRAALDKLETYGPIRLDEAEAAAARVAPAPR